GTPPPTGPAQSTLSDSGGRDDKRPLWKRMAAAASANGSITGTGGSSTSGNERADQTRSYKAAVFYKRAQELARGYYGHPQPGNYPNQQFIPPQQNVYPQYTQLQYQQQPSPVFAGPPGHAAGGYFSASPTVPAQHAVANYGQLPPTPHQQPPIAQPPLGDTSKRPLPTPISRSRPASQVYPSTQALPTFGNQPPVSSGFIPPTNHQRNFSVDTVPTAYNAYGGAFNQPNPIPQPNGFTPRPMSMHGMPTNWNVYPAGANPMPSAFNVPQVGTSAPVLPAQQQGLGRSNVPSPSIVIPNIPQTSTAGAPVSPGQPGADGKRPLPTRPPGQSQPTTPNEIPPPLPSKSPNQAPVSSGKRALPASPSLPLVPPTSAARPAAVGPSGSQSLPTLATSPVPNTSPPPATNDSTSFSSPTKRALPTAPGGGGITPGRSFTLPQPGTSSLPQQPPATMGQPQSFKVVTLPSSSMDAPTLPPSSTRSAPTPTPADIPSSTPSSYASARSTFTSSISGTPPPTGPAQSTLSDS
ncbi:16428_t:CDS:2, partial [Acaulospora colombiana]